MPDAILSALWRASWQAGVICLLVLALRWTLRDRLPPAWRCRLWGLVFLRLAVPVAGPASPLSLFNVVPADPLPTWPAATVVVVERTPVADLADADAPVPAAAPTPPARPVWPAVLLAGWIAGATTLAAVMAVAHVRFARRVRRESVPTPADWDAAWADVSGPRRPPLVVTAAVSSPALFGLVRGRLLLPPDVADRLSPAQLRLVFRHEHAHVRRWDLAIGWATVLVRCVYWFHPLAWAAVAGRRVDAELACDDRVTAATADPAAYGRTLLAVVAGGGRVPALGMADARTDLRRRLARVANGRRPGWGSAALAAAITAAVGCAALTASDRPANVTRTYDRFWPPDYSGTPIEVTTGSPTTLQSTTRPLPPGESVRVAMIRQSITPAAWGHHGVDVHDDGKFVVVTAPPETQAQVERLIAEKMIQVSVETRVLELRPSQVRAAGLDVPAVGVVGPLADDGVSRLVRAVELDAKSTSLTSPRLTLFNGQRALIVVETQQAYVSSLTPITAPGAILFDPNVSNTVVTGLVNNARVSALADRSAVDLTSEVQVARLLSLDKVEVAATTRPSIHGTYQVPHHRVLKVSADGVRVPTGHAVWTHGRWVDHRGELSPSGGPTLQGWGDAHDHPDARAATAAADPDAAEPFVVWKVTVLKDATPSPAKVFPRLPAATRAAAAAESGPYPAGFARPSLFTTAAYANRVVLPVIPAVPPVDGGATTMLIPTGVAHRNVLVYGDDDAAVAARRRVDALSGTVGARLAVDTDLAVIPGPADAAAEADVRGRAKALHIPVVPRTAAAK